MVIPIFISSGKIRTKEEFFVNLFCLLIVAITILIILNFLSPSMSSNKDKFNDHTVGDTIFFDIGEIINNDMTESINFDVFKDQLNIIWETN